MSNAPCWCFSIPLYWSVHRRSSWLIRQLSTVIPFVDYSVFLIAHFTPKKDHFESEAKSTGRNKNLTKHYSLGGVLDFCFGWFHISSHFHLISQSWLSWHSQKTPRSDWSAELFPQVHRLLILRDLATLKVPGSENFMVYDS